jgi:hypothetical protein
MLVHTANTDHQLASEMLDVETARSWLEQIERGLSLRDPTVKTDWAVVLRQHLLGAYLADH